MATDPEDGSARSADVLDTFYEKLEETVVQQARMLINQGLYTKSILSTLPIALLATDEKGLIVTANRSAEQILDLRIDGGEGVTIEKAFAAYPDLVEKLALSLRDGTASRVDSQSLASGQQRQKVVNVYIQPLRDEDGAICGTLVALEDQTYVRFLKEAFKRYMPQPNPEPIVAVSKAMQRIAERVAGLAEAGRPILVTGPRGAGKSFVAAKIHGEGHKDREAPFIVVDCRWLGEQERYDFLFGAEEESEPQAGAIRFRSLHDYGLVHLAEKGSLVLLHVEALPVEAQRRLCRYLEAADRAETRPGVQLILTTGEDLKALAGQGLFDEPLARRLLETTVGVPSLFERRKDILPLATLFLGRAAAEGSARLSNAAENLLVSRRYATDNVRELREAIRLASLIAGSGDILPEHVFTGAKEEGMGLEVDLSRLPFVRWLTGDRVLAALRGAVLAFFAAIVIMGLVAPGTRAGAFFNSLVWGLWWPALVIVFLLLGRLWCTVCPLSSAAGLVRRLGRLSLPPPGWLKTWCGALMPLGFLVIVWVEHAFHMTERATATSFLLLSLIAAATVFALVFDRETWCRYLCPLGNLGAVFSVPAVLGVRANPGVCGTRCTTHECVKGTARLPGCPVFHHPVFARDAHVCKLCFNCIKNCTHDSARLVLRPPLLRAWRQADIGESIVPFALVVLFVSPCMLATRALGALASTPTFTIAIGLAVAVALLAARRLPAFLSSDRDVRTSVATRVALAFLILAWGPLTSFHLSNSAVLASFTVEAVPGTIGSGLLPAGRVSLLLVSQMAVIAIATALAGVTLWALRSRLRRERIAVPWRTWGPLLAAWAIYPGLCAGLALLAGSR